MSEPITATESTDDDLFVRIRDVILRHPHAFRDAGQWLDDEYFDVQAYEAKQTKKPCTQQNSDSDQPFKPQKAKRRQPSDNQDWVQYTLRFQAAVGFYVDRAIKSDLAHPTHQESQRCLLMAWLMTDPEANQRDIKLTQFEKWPWEPDYQNCDVFRYGRKFVSDNTLRWWTPATNQSQIWIDLCRRCLGRMVALLPPDEADASEIRGASSPNLVHAVPPAERMALIEHADALDAYADLYAQEAQCWLRENRSVDVDLGKPFWDLHLTDTNLDALNTWKREWEAKNPSPATILGVRHLWLMLGLEGSSAGSTIWMETLQIDALREIRDAARRLSVYAANIILDPRLHTQRGENEHSIAADLRSWLMCVLRNETHVLDSYLRHIADWDSIVREMYRLRPEHAKRLPLSPELQAAIHEDRKALQLSVNASVSRIKINERTQEITVGREVCGVQSPSSFDWLVSVIRANGRLVPAPAGKRRHDLFKNLHATLKNIVDDPVSGRKGGTALKLDWRMQVEKPESRP